MSCVLVVEDDQNTRSGLVEILTLEGFEVKSACDGRSALRTASSGMDILLTDLRLPDISGIDLVEKLQMDATAFVPIMMTAYGTPELYRRGEMLGIHTWLRKPLDIEELLRLLREISVSAIANS